MALKSQLLRRVRADLLLDLDPRILGTEVRQAEDLLQTAWNHARVINDSKLSLLVGDLQVLHRRTLTQTIKLLGPIQCVARAILQTQLHLCSPLTSESSERGADLLLQVDAAARRAALGFDLLRGKFAHLITKATTAANIAQAECGRSEARLCEIRAGLIDVQAARSQATAEYGAAFDGLVAAKRDTARVSQRERKAARCAAFARCAYAVTRAATFVLCPGSRSPGHCNGFFCFPLATDCVAVQDAEDAQREKREVVATKMRLHRRLRTAVLVIEEASNRVARARSVLERETYKITAARDSAHALVCFSAIIMRYGALMGQLQVGVQLARNEQLFSSVRSKLSNTVPRNEGEICKGVNSESLVNESHDALEQSSQFAYNIYAKWSTIEDVCGEFAGELNRKVGFVETRLLALLHSQTVHSAVHLLNVEILSVSEEGSTQETALS